MYLTEPLLELLGDEVRASWSQASTAKRLRASRTFVREGDSGDQAFILRDGIVRIHHRAERGRLTAHLLRAPGIIGHAEIVGGIKHALFATTVTPCELEVLGKNEFLAAYQDETFSRCITRALIDTARLADERNRDLAFSNVPTRLVRLLLDCAAIFGNANSIGTELEFNLSQRVLAQDLGVTRKAVWEALAKLREAGLLTKRNGHYVIGNQNEWRARAKY